MSFLTGHFVPILECVALSDKIPDWQVQLHEYTSILNIIKTFYAKYKSTRFSKYRFYWNNVIIFAIFSLLL